VYRLGHYQSDYSLFVSFDEGRDLVFPPLKPSVRAPPGCSLPVIICYSFIQAYTFGLPMLAVLRCDPSPVASYSVQVILIGRVAITILAAMV
jgi:hypothetical protein